MNLILFIFLFSNILVNQIEPPWAGFSVKNQKIIHGVEAIQATNLPSYPCFKYPHSDIDSILGKVGKDKVYIFAYGSLLNRESASRTLSKEVMQTYAPAIIFGYSRTFDRHVPQTKRWGEKKRANDTGMLNLFKSEGIVNGVVFEVGKDDLSDLIKREEGYDLVPVITSHWKANNQEPFVSYTFIASQKPRQGQIYTQKCINPVPNYALASQKGASLWGKDFEALWINSTYLSDCKTPYAKWLKDTSVDMRCDESS